MKEYTELKSYDALEIFMSFLSAFLFSFAANIDSFLIGMSFGIQQKIITPFQSVCISLITLLGTLAALLSGDLIFLILPQRYADHIGNILMEIFGIYYLGRFFLTYFSTAHLKISTESCDSVFVHSTPIVLSSKTVFICGLSLSINNLGIGLGAGITDMNPLFTAFLSFLVSALLLLFGNRAGHLTFFQKCDHYADLISGFLLLLLGLCL